MKKALPILFFLFIHAAFACTCMQPSITEKYMESDFVARIIITKNYKNTKGSNEYRADIKIVELFKGNPIKSIYVYGRSDGALGDSCSIFIPEGTELIAYADKYDGKLHIGMCSGLLYLDKQNVSREKMELDFLRTLKKNKIDFTDKIHYMETCNLYNKLEQFNGMSFEKDFGIYMITLSSDLKIKKVELVSSLDESVDDKLMDILRETCWESFYQGIENKVPEDSRLLVGIYHYHDKEDESSFLSSYSF